MAVKKSRDRREEAKYRDRRERTGNRGEKGSRYSGRYGGILGRSDSLPVSGAVEASRKKGRERNGRKKGAKKRRRREKVDTLSKKIIVLLPGGARWDGAVSNFSRGNFGQRYRRPMTKSSRRNGVKKWVLRAGKWTSPSSRSGPKKGHRRMDATTSCF
ncbi:hypothetical protein K0M31_013523 [Melipona bicolor]|uniref:Uncharacterized protein n=1 Tax=Melipona bicolor TaxID=60889 RepID=A0AA40FI75_9HYME|nr:hypothetical protein K0M31_013523 [Melipona bicolor]